MPQNALIDRLYGIQYQLIGILIVLSMLKVTTFLLKSTCWIIFRVVLSTCIQMSMARAGATFTYFRDIDSNFNVKLCDRLSTTI